MQKGYDPKKIEGKWQKAWAGQDLPKKAGSKGKYYILDMFPYPSGDGLHVGHVENFTATDILARFKRFRGYDVLRPMGWDAFGLPAENFAIKTGIHPAKKTLQSIKNFKRQMQSIGLSYEWEREINTSSSEYYQWTQWMFLFLYKNGLAYKKKAKVNWCESCHTVLANEQVIDGKCDRSGDIVIQKDLEQWFFKITDFVEPTKSLDGEKISGLLSGLDNIDWPESTKAAQKHWIGRSEGAQVQFPVVDSQFSIEVFTTRLDTIYGCTYVVVAPEHPIVALLLNDKAQISNIKNEEEIRKYIADTKKKTDLERTELNKEKTGVCLEGIEAVHPFTGERLPVYVADYVLGTYGTGAVMGVPAHDERDYAFAKKYQLEITETIVPKMYPTADQKKMLASYEKEGEKYFYRGQEMPADTKEWADTLREKLSVAMSIVEVGSGNGWLADYYGKSGLVVECTDAVDTFVDYLEKSGKKTRKVDLLKDSLGIAAYDCIVGASVLHHFTAEQFEIIVEKFQRSLNKNGILALRVKKGNGTAFVDSAEGLKVFYKYWTEEELRQVLEKMSFVIEELKTNERGTHISVIARKKGDDTVFTDDGVLVASKEFSGLTSEEARNKMAAWLKKEKLGKKVVHYRLRDWLISRQRYWGAPIPIIYCDDCGTVPVPEKDLPVKLPTDVDFRPTGESPLQRSKSFHKVKCPTCGAKARRESDTMDTFVCSSWYYLRFADPKNTKQFASKKALAKYLPVDFYMGGAEHTVLHLLYARFFTKALMKHGYLTFDEPFQKLRHQGMILAPDGQKMSKSKGNVINPDQMVAEFGADSLRLYEMFMGPLEDMKAWNTGSIIGVRRFLEKVWKLQEKQKPTRHSYASTTYENLLYKTIDKVTDDIEALKFNTAISALMILVNGLENEVNILTKHYKEVLVLLAPFAPHIAEELWTASGEKKSIFLAVWPKYGQKRTGVESVNIAVQVNGKVRAVIAVATGTSETEVKALALDDEKVQFHIGDNAVHKVIYVPGKIVSIVI